jgi:ABC-type polysaccharide/polyol phosphate export permease
MAGSLLNFEPMTSAGPAAALIADFREMFAEQIAHRELLFRMAHRDLLLRYKQTVMGVLWAIFMPLVNTAIFSIIFTRVAPISTGVPYPVYAFSGLLIWNAFSSSLRFAVSSLTSNSNLVTKLYFPREIFPISAVIVTLLDSVLASLVLVALMIYYHVAVSPLIALLPLVLVIQICFTCAMALLLSMANLFYRDVKYLFEIAITVWMFATSVVYPVDLVHGRLGAVLRLNPMTPLIDAFRAAIIGGFSVNLEAFVIASVVSVVGLLASWLIFHRAEFTFAENI